MSYPEGPVPGQPQQPNYGAPMLPPTAPKTNTLAITSLVAAFFVSLGAIICGHIALNQIKRTGEGGRGLAIAGLILGYIGFIGGLIWIILIVVLAASGMY